MPERIQLSRRKGWRMPADAVKVDRSTIFGNPFSVDMYGQAGAVDLFRRWLNGAMSVEEIRAAVRQDRRSEMSLLELRDRLHREIPRLAGKGLACWCRPGLPCHADVLLEIASRRFICVEAA